MGARTMTAIMQESAFGPMLPVLEVKSIDRFAVPGFLLVGKQDKSAYLLRVRKHNGIDNTYVVDVAGCTPELGSAHERTTEWESVVITEAREHMCSLFLCVRRLSLQLTFDKFSIIHALE